MGRSFVFNALSGQFDLVDSGGIYWLDPVATFADLPATDADGATRIVRGEDAAYTYDIGSLTWIFAGKIKSAAFGSSPNSNAFSVAANNTLTLQPADATNPGGVSTTTQTFAGNKTFSGTIAASNLSGTNTGDVTLSAFGSSANANAASLSGQALTLQPASGSFPGGVSTTTQTFAGAKTFSTSVTSPGFTSTANTTTARFVAGDSPTDIPIVVSGSNIYSSYTTSNNAGGHFGFTQVTHVTSAAGGALAFAKSRGTFASPTIVSSGDRFGVINSYGWDGTDFKQGSTISFEVDGTAASNSMPGRIVFGVTPTGSTTVATALTISQDKSSTFTGTVNLGALTASTALALDSSKNIVSNTITGSGNTVYSSAPTLTNPIVGTQSQGDSSTKAASTSYVDVAIANAIAGVNPAVAAQAATTSASDTSSFTYNNGVSGIGATLTGAVNTVLTVDGYTFTALGQRLLVKNDTQSPSGAFNGVYYVTQVQTAILPLVLTRTLDFDTPSDINNTGAIPVINGTVNGTTQWVLTSSVTTVGTSALTFAEFSRNPADYLLKSSGDINETSFAAANNQSSVANVTSLAFANATVRSAKVLLSVYVNATSSLYEAFELLLIQKGASWEMSQTSVGDASGFVFTVTNAGQVQYVDSNYSGFVSATVKFRAITTSV